MKITNANLFQIRKGLNLLNGVKNFELGMLRAKVAHIIDPEIEAIEEGLKNDKFEEIRQSLSGKTQEEMQQIEKENKDVIDERRKQIIAYEKHLKQPYAKNNLPTIPTSLIPEDVDTEVCELLFPILKEVKRTKKEK